MAPAKRRRVSGPAAAAKSNAAQSTLSFRSSKAHAANDHPNKVVKSASPSSKAKKAQIGVSSDELLDEAQAPSQAIGRDAEDVDEVAEVNEEVADPELEEDVRAKAIKESQIKAYWAAKEKDRKAPRVHQGGMSIREKILREFDMSSRYGPSIGKTRLERWRRANKLNMNPPIEVLAVLLKEEEDRPGKAQRSIVDELMSSRTGKDIALEA